MSIYRGSVEKYPKLMKLLEKVMRSNDLLYLKQTHRVNLLTLLGRHRRLSDVCLQFICSVNNLIDSTIFLVFIRTTQCCVLTWSIRYVLNRQLTLLRVHWQKKRKMKRIVDMLKHFDRIELCYVTSFVFCFLDFLCFFFCSFLSLCFSFPTSVIWSLASQL